MLSVKDVPGHLQDASAFARSSPSHTLRGPMAKLSASFKLHFANGPTLAPIGIRMNDQPNCPIGSIATIGIGHMVLESQHTYPPPRFIRGQPVEAPELANL